MASHRRGKRERVCLDFIPKRGLLGRQRDGSETGYGKSPGLVLTLHCTNYIVRSFASSGQTKLMTGLHDCPVASPALGAGGGAVLPPFFFRSLTTIKRRGMPNCTVLTGRSALWITRTSPFIYFFFLGL